MGTVAESVPPRRHPIHLTREHRASLDLAPRPTAMRLPQVINAVASLPGYLTASFNTRHPSVSFVLLIVQNSVDTAGL